MVIIVLEGNSAKSEDMAIKFGPKIGGSIKLI